MNFEICSL
uniref:Uncharacterized protein n=2 Tax=Staphylococcus TaxID=1279 RepID=A0A0F6PBH2_STASA|nr:hypothetical protein [Staphylococcus saprophyticus]AJK31390.1 hypothetical protein [Staphylococcus xylosus]